MSPTNATGERTVNDARGPAGHSWGVISSRPLTVSGGITFVARGGGWEWCSACRSFEHFSGLVPDWWSSDLDVDESKLTALPDVLERAVQREQE